MKQGIVTSWPMLAPGWVGVWVVLGVSPLLAQGAPPAGDPPAATESAGLFARLDTNADGQIVLDELSAGQRRLFARLLRIGDANADGRLDQHELRAALKPSTPEKPILQSMGGEMPDAQHARLLLVRLDVDRDSSLTRSEAPDELRDAFDKIAARADQNNDGTVNRFELNQTGPQLIQVARRVTKQKEWNVGAELKRLKQQQGNAIYRFDGPISPLEALVDPQRAKELFYQLDTNGDGRLALDEVPAQFRKRLRWFFSRADQDRDNTLTRNEYFDASEWIKKFAQRKKRANRGGSDAKSPTQKDRAKQGRQQQRDQQSAANSSGDGVPDKAPLAAEMKRDAAPRRQAAEKQAVEVPVANNPVANNPVVKNRAANDSERKSGPTEK